MPTKQTVPTSMRKTANLERALALNVELARKGQFTLMRIQAAVQNASSLDELRSRVQQEIERCEAAAKERLSKEYRENEAQARVSFADEDDEG